jgi:hypothetical protein
MPARLNERDLTVRHGASLMNEEVDIALFERYRVSPQAMSFCLPYLGHIEL